MLQVIFSDDEMLACYHLIVATVAVASAALASCAAIGALASPCDRRPLGAALLGSVRGALCSPPVFGAAAPLCGARRQHSVAPSFTALSCSIGAGAPPSLVISASRSTLVLVCFAELFLLRF